ncbi:Protein dml-1 [Erysiphe neolycopersici]|uniref:Protein dml-1 n=1 Tax=Erysiphe neolycopersici TaxID=212602 RepID=A0A420H8R1_9PEZI|nr:Protein dml-1 [Erysiphe neolycopersici]
MHEIISLQFGQRSNYLATHFWNTQESYFTYTNEKESIVDHDIHFRPGIGVDGTETFTPRTVIYDLKGGFGSLRKINALYGIEEPDTLDILWNKPAVIQRLDSIEKCAYQQSLEQNLEPESLDSDLVRYWSDYNRVYYHPKSIVQLNEYEVGSTSRPFDSWDESNGCFAARYLEQIKDEYSKTDVIFWGLEEDITTEPREKRHTSLLNVAKSVSVITPESTLFIPLTLPSKALPPYVTLERKSKWHVSALLSVAVESMTLLSRLRQNNIYRETLDQLECMLNTNGRQNITKLCMSIDQDSSNYDDVAVVPKISELSRDTQLLSTKKSSHVPVMETKSNIEVFDINFFPTEIGDQVTRRPLKKLHVFSQYEIHRKNSHTQDCKVNEKIQNEPFQKIGGSILPVVSRKIVPLPFPLLDSFPQIFDRSGTPSSVTVRTSLMVDSSIVSRLKGLEYIASRAVATDEREALSNSLGELAEAYEEGWDSGSDEGED